MRYWLPVLALLLIAAIMLPVSRAVHTIIGDAQIVFALALVALLVRLVAQAIAMPNADTLAQARPNPREGGRKSETQSATQAAETPP